MKKIKIIGIILILVIIIYILLVSIELIRFNNHLGTKPLITMKTVDVNLQTDNNLQKEKFIGIGYTVEYEYFVHQKEDSDNQVNEIVSGEFKLFDKIILGAWIK